MTFLGAVGRGGSLNMGDEEVENVALGPAGGDETRRETGKGADKPDEQWKIISECHSV